MCVSRQAIGQINLYDIFIINDIAFSSPYQQIVQDKNFDSEKVLEEGDICIYRYKWHGKGGGIINDKATKDVSAEDGN